MDVVKTSLSRIQLENLQPAARSILQKLEQSGLFRALVLENNGRQVLLDTAFGKLAGQSPQTLQQGDQILARIVQDQSRPTIKIEQVDIHQPVVPRKILKQLLKLASIDDTAASSLNQTRQKKMTVNLPQVIKVLDHSQKQTRIQMGQKTYSIPQLVQLKPGDTLLLRINDKQQPEVRRIDPPQVLRKALTELLPRLNTPSGRTPALASLQKLVSAILQLKPQDLARPEQTLQRVVNTTLENAQPAKTVGKQVQTSNRMVANTSASQKLPASTPANTATARSQPTSSVTSATGTIGVQTAALPRETEVLPGNTETRRVISQLLQQLSKPAANAGRIDAQTIRQVLTTLSLMQMPPAPTSSSLPQNIPRQIQLLKQLISQSPQAMRELIQQVILSHRGTTQKVAVDEVQLQEISNLFRNELLQQLDQTSSQLLLQKTILKLNQELQQPIQVTLNIPVQFKEDTVQLKLKLKQHQQSKQPQDQQWEIDLSFDLPLLGLINTRLLLQESRLSASFWAVRDSTRLLIDTHLNQFKQQLVKSGFELGVFHSYPGEPPKRNQDEALQPHEQSLLDVKA